MNPLATALLNLLSSVPDAAVAVVHPEDYRDQLRPSFVGVFIPATNQATIMSGCVGHFPRAGGRVTALYVRTSVPRGEVRIGTVALLKEHHR